VGNSAQEGLASHLMQTHLMDSSGPQTARLPQEHGCNDGWVCEVHPTLGWPHDDCGGPGVPSPICQPEEGPPRLPDDWESIISTEDAK